MFIAYDVDDAMAIADEQKIPIKPAKMQSC